MRDHRTPEEIEAEMEAAAASGDFDRAQSLKREYERSERERSRRRPGMGTSPGVRDTPEGRAARKASARTEAAAGRGRALTAVAGASIAIALGSLAIAGWMAAESRGLADRLEGTLVDAVVATRDIAPGELLAEGDLAMGRAPAALVPTDAATEIDGLVGKRTLTTQSEGAPLALSSIQASESPAGITTAIGEGMVGLMVSLDAPAAASPLLSVGDRVDVLGTVSDGTVGSTRVIAPDVRVIALDGMLSGDGSKGYSSVTLELTPEAANAVAGTDGIHLAVRPAIGAPDRVAEPASDEGQPPAEQPAPEAAAEGEPSQPGEVEAGA